MASTWRIVHLFALCIVCHATSQPATQVGHVRTRSLNEASGLVMSRKHPGVYWTHNDGGDGVLYAIRADGFEIGHAKIDADFHDWEDIAIDAAGHLYLADIGNNERKRHHMTVYRIDEPDPASMNKIEITATWRLTYPDEPFNCESLFTHDGNGYVISKLAAPQRATLYKFPLSEGKRPRENKHTLERVCELPITEPVTAADLTADGKSLAVLTNRTLSIFQIDGDVKKASDATPQKIPLPPIQSEGCAFNPEGVLVIAESGEILQVKLDPSPATTQATTRGTR